MLHNYWRSFNELCWCLPMWTKCFLIFLLPQSKLIYFVLSPSFCFFTQVQYTHTHLTYFFILCRCFHFKSTCLTSPRTNLHQNFLSFAYFPSVSSSHFLSPLDSLGHVENSPALTSTICFTSLPPLFFLSLFQSLL